MCSEACIQFGVAHLPREDVQGKAVLEVGARNVNGALRSHVEALRPTSYLGVDLRLGAGVDEVCSADQLVERYGPNSFDLVFSTEMLEHVRDWRVVTSNLKRVVRPGGILLVTTRSKGYALHGYPHDFWRYELEDVRVLFPEFVVEALLKDPSEPGVFFKGRKPKGEFLEADLGGYALYSIIARRRTVELSELEIVGFRAAVAAGRMLPGPVRRILTRAIGL